MTFTSRYAIWLFQTTFEIIDRKPHVNKTYDEKLNAFLMN